MCLLISKPAGVKIDQKYLKNGWRENPHGAGFAVAKNGQIFMRKGFSNFKSFWKVFREYQEYPAVCHFRWANIGKINRDNCHPFIVDKDLVFAHNGTIPIETDGEKSDTRTFCEEIARKCREYNIHFLKDDLTRWFISKSIGNSKLVFLDESGELTIINKERGEEHNGVWFSNGDYKKFPVKKDDKTDGIKYFWGGKQYSREEWERLYMLDQYNYID